MRVLSLAVAVALISVGCGGDDSPTAPTAVSSVTVAPANPNETVFIGQTTQFEATSTLLSNGQSDMRTGAWGSDNANVATVDQNGLVTGVSAGEATIFVDVNPRGSMLIRVFPSFGGTWTGNEVLAGCQDSGDFEGICTDPELGIGTLASHNSTFTQTGASVDAVIQTGTPTAPTTASMTGSVTVGGELQLPTTSVLPADPVINAQVQNWRSRSDVPTQMTGMYDAVFTAPGLAGSFEVVIRLENVVQSMSAASVSQPTQGRSLVDVAKRFLADSR